MPIQAASRSEKPTSLAAAVRAASSASSVSSVSSGSTVSTGSTVSAPAGDWPAPTWPCADRAIDATTTDQVRR